ncbi:aminopeptidase N-like isoform X1 [Schistocerca serialis cubense]|uniref:aminopeptidase N-like isoform X1 n=2 Tax=Schistocerca serialis cubense TaxID=2023355 RepID=UPI00214EF06C|nr:aminopeptidase N-like isoform X1 [Schistocerca serialis cubense]
MPGLVDQEAGAAAAGDAEGGTVNGAWEETEMRDMKPPAADRSAPSSSAGPSSAHKSRESRPPASSPSAAPAAAAPAAAMPLSTSRDEFLHADAIEYGRKGGCFVSTGRALAFVFAAVLFAALVGVLVYYFGVATRKQAPVAQAATNGTARPGGGEAPPSGGAGGGGEGEGGPQKPPPASERLSPRVRPHLYELHLKPYLGEGTNFTFIGHVAITISVDEGTSADTVVFHSKQLNISAEEVAITVDNTNTTASPAAGGGNSTTTTTSSSGGRPTVVSQRADPAQETYSLSVSPPLQPGARYVLEIPFRGVLRDSLTGFYRTSYREDGRTKWMALTQFEATDARAAFPCFDEPGMKARFQISIAHSTNYTAVSNMPIVRSEQLHGEPGWVVDHFGITPPMSTYLVAFIVSEMVFETVNDSVPVMTTPKRGPAPTVTNTAAPTIPPAVTSSSSATPRGKSLSTGFSTDTGVVDTRGTNETSVTTIESSPADTGPSSRYTTVGNATSHELSDATSGTHSSEVTSSASAEHSSNTAESSPLFNASHTASTRTGTSGTTIGTPAQSSGSGNTSTVEMAPTSSSTILGTRTLNGSTATPVGTPTSIGSTSAPTRISSANVSTSASTGIPSLIGSTSVPTAIPSLNRSTGAPTGSPVSNGNTGTLASYTSSGTVSHSGSAHTVPVDVDTSLASRTESMATSSSIPVISSSSAPGNSAETTFEVTDSEAGGSSVSVVNVTAGAHGPAVTTAPSRGASHAMTTTVETVVPTGAITALPLTGGSVSASHSSRGNRYATAVFIPSTSQVANGRSGSSFPGNAGTSAGFAVAQANALFPTPGRRKKREAPSTNASANSTAVPLQIRMIVRPHLRKQAHYALSVTRKILNFYADYFGIAYPLPKMDFAAIPDFQYGGMENWGLVTYWETQVLIGPETTTDSLEKAATTVVHELGHQWFGNLVTPTWWTDIWLNEGFATYLEYLGTDFIEPTWEMIDKFVNDMHDVMSVDSMQSTHPVSNAVGSAAQILQAFDEISYTKGACLIRMLNHSLTEPMFRKGMVIYIDKWKYSNAKQDDLWWSMEEAVRNSSLHEHALPQNATVKQVMDSWTLQPGFPVVTAIRNYVNGSVTINQTRFTTDGRPVTNSSLQAWYIPVSFATQDDVRSGNVSTKPRIWLGVEEGKRSTNILGVLPPGAPGTAKWLLLNLQQTGYYRVNYDTTNWELLVRQLATAPLQLPASTRAQLISDSLSLARAGALPYGIALNLTRYLRDSRAEVSLVPWQAFLDGTLHLEAGLSLTPTYVPLKRYMLSVLMPLLERLKLDPQPTDSLPTKQLRARVLSRALRLEARNVTDWAERLFTRWMAAPTNYTIPVDLRPTVYCAAVMEGGDAEFNFAMAQFRKTTDPAQQRVLLSGLMCSRQPSLIAMLLNAPLEGKIMRVQDALTIWRAVPRNPVARAIAFDYVREHWTNLTKRFSDTDFPIKDMLEGATAGLSTQVQLDDLKAFRESHRGQFAYTSAAIERAIESLQEVVSWTQRFHKDIANWLDSPAAAVPHHMYRAMTPAARPSIPVVSSTRASPVAV